jgi:hypothetical protein
MRPRDHFKTDTRHTPVRVAGIEKSRSPIEPERRFGPRKPITDQGVAKVLQALENLWFGKLLDQPVKGDQRLGAYEGSVIRGSPPGVGRRMSCPFAIRRGRAQIRQSHKSLT